MRPFLTNGTVERSGTLVTNQSWNMMSRDVSVRVSECLSPFSFASVIQDCSSCFSMDRNPIALMRERGENKRAKHKCRAGNLTPGAEHDEEDEESNGVASRRRCCCFVRWRQVGDRNSDSSRSPDAPTTLILLLSSSSSSSPSCYMSLVHASPIRTALLSGGTFFIFYPILLCFLVSSH